MATYSIAVHLGRQEAGSADWTSEVYLTMFGAKASSPELRLRSAEPVEPDAPATYLFALTDLGEIQRVRVRHDDAGVGPGCYLDRIVVRAAGTLEEWTFLCQRWLARHEDDGVTERTLDALGRGSSAELPRSQPGPPSR